MQDTPPEEDEKPIVLRDYYSTAENLVRAGFPAEGALTAIYTIDDTLESIDVPGLQKAIHECLPLIQQIKAGNGYQKVLQRVYEIISPVRGVGAKGAEVIVRLFTPNGEPKKGSKEDNYNGLW